MPSGRGFWLDPRTNALYEVATHNDWLLDPENQRRVGLSPDQVRVLASLDPVREIDEIRMVGLLAGLVRLRDYYKHVSVQFYAVPTAEPTLLSKVVATIPEVTADRYPVLAIQNLSSDAVARLDLLELAELLSNEEAALRMPAVEVEYNAELRRRLNRLLTMTKR